MIVYELGKMMWITVFEPDKSSFWDWDNLGRNTAGKWVWIGIKTVVFTVDVDKTILSNSLKRVKKPFRLPENRVMIR